MTSETISGTPSPVSRALPGYEDWPAWFEAAVACRPVSEHAARLAQHLGVVHPSRDLDVRWGAVYESDTTRTTELTWSTGFGPRTTAYLATPVDAGNRRLPGLLGLHDHSGQKWSGATRLMDARISQETSAAAIRDSSYGGRGVAQEYARRGYAVLVHDTFTWGSRRFRLAENGSWGSELAERRVAEWGRQGIAPTDAMVHNAVASAHENLVSKTAGLIGTTFAGAVASDDLAAMSVLASLDVIDADRLGCFGFSGGGCRSVLLAALDTRIRAYVVTCAMATYGSLLPDHVDIHSWLLCIPGLRQLMDWPDITAATDAIALVQYARDDVHFPLRGMLAADERLRHLHGDGYRASFHGGGHRFDVAMQDEAAAFFDDTL